VLPAQKFVIPELLWPFQCLSVVENGYERQGLQETSVRPAQFEAQAKKKRREQGKMHRGAQLANTGEDIRVQALHGQDKARCVPDRSAAVKTMT
jgi:hypothetical protein